MRVNDRVIQTINNYNLEVFNGETGKIVDIYEQEGECKLVVDFGDRNIIYPDKNSIELELAYAVSIHKSQGSQIPIVIMPFHQSLDALLNRNTIYTAWTRAEKRVVCIGDNNILYKSIIEEFEYNRNSYIRYKLTETTI